MTHAEAAETTRCRAQTRRRAEPGGALEDEEQSARPHEPVYSTAVMNARPALPNAASPMSSYELNCRRRATGRDAPESDSEASFTEAILLVLVAAPERLG